MGAKPSCSDCIDCTISLGYKDEKPRWAKVQRGFFMRMDMMRHRDERECIFFCTHARKIAMVQHSALRYYIIAD